MKNMIVWIDIPENTETWDEEDNKVNGQLRSL